MPSTSIGGCSIHYRVLGDKGSRPVVLTPGGRSELERVLPLAERLAPKCRVIVWDRSNLGASDLRFTGASDNDLWCDQLCGLMQALDARGAVLAAASSGARLSIRMALRYPDMVGGLFLWLLSAGPVAVQLRQMYYGEAALLAETGGMAAVAAMPYWAARIRANPANRARLLAQDAREFSSVMRRWAATIRPEDALIGVTADELRQLSVRTRIVAGADDGGHRRETMEQTAHLIPGCELIDPPGFREEWLVIKAGAETGTGYELVGQLPNLIGIFVDAPG